MSKKIDKDLVEDVIGLTELQEGLLINYLRDSNTVRYSEQLYLKLAGRVTYDEVEQAWAKVVSSNEMLRSVFRWEGMARPVIIILKSASLNLRYYDLTNLNDYEKEEGIDKIRKDDLAIGFDLAESPFRVTFIKLNDEEHVMLICNHHILYDGWSTNIILREFFNGLNGVSTEQKAPFKEYVLWLKNRDRSREEIYWTDYLKNFVCKSELPFLNPAKQNDSGSLSRRKSLLTFSTEELADLKRFCGARRITMANLFYCAWGIVLSKFNSENPVFGITAASRPEPIENIQNSVGLFINTIPFIFQNDGNKKIEKIIQLVQQQFEDREEFHHSSLQDISTYLKHGKGELFDSIVVVENYPVDRSLTENQTVKIQDFYMDYLTHYKLSIVVSMHETIQITFTYDENVLDSNSASILLDYLCQSIKQIIYHSEKRLNDIHFAVPLVHTESQVTTMETVGTVLDLFRKQVDLRPMEIALRVNNSIHSYSDLDQRANFLAQRYIDSGLRPADRGILLYGPSREVVVAMLAIWKCGASFIPVSPDIPEERLQFIIADSQAKLISARKNDPLVRQISLPVFDFLYDQLETTESPQERKLELSDVAYVIYTSGTTGMPKGVEISNQSLAEYIIQAVKHYIRDERVAFPLFTSPAFDLTMTSIFAPLISGNNIVVYHSENNPFSIESIWQDNLVDVIKLTPSHLRLLKENLISKAMGMTVLKSRIRRLIVGGENLTVILAKEISDLFGEGLEIYNEYGPTEATVGCMIHKYEKNDNRLSVPIGKPLGNHQIYLLNEAGELVEFGAVGEIHISGSGLAKGYLNNDFLTNGKFITNPFIPGSKMYRTGDLARYLSNGNIEYIGRNDRQIKVNGYRIELEEIESKLLKFGKDDDQIKSFNIKDAIKELAEIKRCVTCLLPSTHPSISFDQFGVCSVCAEFFKYKQQIEAYFKTENDFTDVANIMKSRNAEFDCLLLYSGGKDSTYVLYKLMDHGLKVLTYTFDNGFISKTAFQNIESTTKKLGVKNIVASSDRMKKVFSESLRSSCSSCHGCWHAINTFGIQIANDNYIRHIVSGLSRGQIYDMRLNGIFGTKIFEENKVEEQLKIFRNSFHSSENRYSRLLGISHTISDIEAMQFVDFFRYYNTPVSNIKSYLQNKGWVQPKDTGFCSSNCLINDIGIYTHIKEKGDNFYTEPVSWDIRLDQYTREEGMLEITSFGSTEKHVKNVLSEIGYPQATLIREVVVIKAEIDNTEVLVAYIASDLPPNISEVRSYLLKKIPDYMIPAHFIHIDKVPLTTNGKIDYHALPVPSALRPQLNNDYIVPTTVMEVKISEICRDILKMDSIGVNDNLFELGASSFELTRITAKLNEFFEKRIGVASLFNLTSISKLAEYYGDVGTIEMNLEDRKGETGPNKLRARRTMLQGN